MHPLVLLTAVTALARMTVSDRYHPDEIRREPISRMAPPPERDPSYWINEAEAGIRERLRRRDNRNVARNIVMFLGDGMSVPTLAAARTLLGQRQGRRGEEAKLAFETFPTTGFSKVDFIPACLMPHTEVLKRNQLQTRITNELLERHHLHILIQICTRRN